MTLDELANSRRSRILLSEVSWAFFVAGACLGEGNLKGNLKYIAVWQVINLTGSGGLLASLVTAMLDCSSKRPVRRNSAEFQV
jgi:hypothetical protein